MSACGRLFKQSIKLISNWGEARRYHNLKTFSQPVIPNLKTCDDLNIFKRFNRNQAIKCWQCGIERKNIAELFCEQCKFIQNPQETDNYFKVFELEENFSIDQKQLTQKYKGMQSVLHPDKFSTRSEEEKHISEEFSSLVNKAYHVLNTPLKRAIHLLGLKGERIEENQTVEDPSFLMEIMELNEEVENADNPEKLIKLSAKNKAELAKIANDIKDCFERNEIQKAKENIIKMKYYNSVSTHINALMRDRGIVE